MADDEPPLLNVAPVERFATPDIAPASEEAAIALKRFQLPPGFQAVLWAAEPMLANPVAINFDQRGRLFVAETYRYGSSTLDIRGYMAMLEEDMAVRTIEDRVELVRNQFGAAGLRELAIEGEVVRLLADTDGDGIADSSTIYADGFNSVLDGIGSGVLPWRGGVWYTNIPSLWKFTGDTRAETRTEVSRGYGVRFGYTGHDLHGLALGHDGKLYFSIGDRGAHVETDGGRTVSTPDTGAVFRCNFDGTGLEIVHRGLRNPQDLLFTENGDLFTGDNDSDQGDLERLVQIVEGGDSGWRVGYQHAPLGNAGVWNLERMWEPRHDGQPTFMLPPICNVEDGPSGIAYYPGTGLTPEYAGTIFMTHFKGSIARSGIQTYKLEPAGATYRAVASEVFLGNALPTDVKFGPDGRLYYSDWVEAWPKSRRGRIYAIFHPDHVADPLVVETQRLIREGMTHRPAEELARLIGHADRRVRLEAQLSLAERGAASLATLAGVATNGAAPPLGRLHAIWGLGQLAGARVPGALAPLRLLIPDTDSEVRAQAARMLGDHADETSASALAGLLNDPAGRVQFFAAQSLGKLGRAEFAAPLIEALRANDDGDVYVRHACVVALARIENAAALTAAITDPSRAVRHGALLALRRLGHPAIARFLEDADPLLVAEAARAINDEPIEEALPALAAFVANPVADETLMLRALNAAFRLGTPARAAELAAFAGRADVSPRLRSEAIKQLVNWQAPSQRDRIVGIYRPLPAPARDASVAREAFQTALSGLLAAGTPDEVQRDAFAAIRALDLRSAADDLFTAVLDDQRADAARVAALSALESFEDPRLAEAVGAAGRSNSPPLRLAALPIAARLSPVDAIPVIESLASSGGPREQRAAFTALANAQGADADRIMAGQLEKLAAGEIAPAVQLDLVEAAGKRSDPRIQKLLSEREAAITASSDPLAPYRVALEGGNENRGRRTFNTHPIMSCQRCHVVDGQGGEAGPDLSLIGAKLTREQLLEAVILPNATIAEGFDSVALTLKSGEVHVGTIAAQDDATITLRLGDLSLLPVKRSEITKRETAPSSMPAIYGPLTSKADLRDLIEYLSSLQSPPVSGGGPRALSKKAAGSGSGHGE